MSDELERFCNKYNERTNFKTLLRVTDVVVQLQGNTHPRNREYYPVVEGNVDGRKIREC